MIPCFTTKAIIKCDGQSRTCNLVIRAGEVVWNNGDQDLCETCATREPGVRIEVTQERWSAHDNFTGEYETGECATCGTDIEDRETYWQESPGTGDVWCKDHRPLERIVGES